MKTRVAAWLRPAEHDLDVARRSRAAGDHDWACHAAAQSGENDATAAIGAAERLLSWVKGHVDGG